MFTTLLIIAIAIGVKRRGASYVGRMLAAAATLDTILCGVLALLAVQNP